MPRMISYEHNGAKEEAAVTPAQHPSSLTGKSWTREHGEPELNEYDMPKPTHVPCWARPSSTPRVTESVSRAMGRCAQGQPQFSYINDWNEWTAGSTSPKRANLPVHAQGNHLPFHRPYNAEFNRCIQPMKDGYTDNYYMQMAQNIRRYKGVRPIPEYTGAREMEIDGDFYDGRKSRSNTATPRRHFPRDYKKATGPAHTQTIQAATTS